MEIVADNFLWKCRHAWRRSAKNTAWCVLGYLDHSKYDMVYNPLANSSLQLEKNKNEEEINFSAPCSDFGGC